MLINVADVNQAEFHKWASHIFNNTHGTYSYKQFSEKIDVDNVDEPDLEASDISETIKFF